MGEWKFPDHYSENAKSYAIAARHAEIQVFLDLCFPALQSAARNHGYALAVHGSRTRDLDLIAAPWTECSSDLETIVTALAEATNKATGWGHISGFPDNEWRERKPHGRVAVTILASAEIHLDISIMPRLGEAIA